MTRILDIDHFLQAVPPGEGSILAAAGGFGVTNHDRVGLITLEGQVLEDAYLPSRDLDALVRRIAHLRPKSLARKGGWNTMHATGWSFAWSDDRAPFVLLDGKGRLAWVENERLHTREGEPASIDRLQIAAVEPFVDNGWVTRGVRVRLRDGSRRILASEDDHASEIDPTYDGLNLMADTFWCHDLAHALAQGLGPPVVDCTG